MGIIRTLNSAHSPVYADADQQTVRLTVVFRELAHLGELTFLAVPNDPESHGPAILARAKAGEFGEIAPYVPPED